jgi:hypothetical protein
MQKTSRTPPVTAIDNVEANVVRLQRRSAAVREAAVRNEDTSLPEQAEILSGLMERASHAVRQVRYFSLAIKQFSLDQLTSSARRAGFVQIEERPQREEASFRWASGAPDLIFSVSFRDPARISIVAESQADIFGLVLTAYSQVPTVSVETNPTVEDDNLGPNAVLFRDMLLTFPGFDDMPSWTKYPEGHMPDAGGLIEMWRDGVSVASVFGHAWKWVWSGILTVWETLRDSWYPAR